MTQDKNQGQPDPMIQKGKGYGQQDVTDDESKLDYSDEAKQTQDALNADQLDTDTGDGNTLNQGYGEGMDAAGLDGRALGFSVDRSFGNSGQGASDRMDSTDNYTDTGPGGYSGIADDPGLGGSTGLADDVGMHIEPGFSVGYDTSGNQGIDGDMGNRVQGGTYQSLADAAEDFDPGAPDDETPIV